MSSEQTKKRNQNRYQLLRAIQTHGPLRRTELADICGIRRSSITGLVDEMIQLEILALTDPSRPRGTLCFKPRAKHIIGVHISSRRIETAIVDLNGKMDGLDVIRTEGDESYKALIDIIVHSVKNLLQRTPQHCLGLAVSVAGIINPERGICTFSNTVPCLRNRPIGPDLEKRLGIKPIVENDVRASCWADSWFDNPEIGYTNVIFLNIGSGIGSALLLNGRTHAGSNSAAGEIGHLQAGDEGRPCGCGKTDCLEAYASMDSIRKDIEALNRTGEALTTPAAIAAAALLEPGVRAVLDAAMNRTARLLAALVSYIDPETIVLGNQDPAFYEVIAPMLQAHLSRYLEGPFSRDIGVHIAAHSQFSALRGVAGMRMDQAFEQDLPHMAAALEA